MARRKFTEADRALIKQGFACKVLAKEIARIIGCSEKMVQMEYNDLSGEPGEHRTPTTERVGKLCSIANCLNKPIEGRRVCEVHAQVNQIKSNSGFIPPPSRARLMAGR